MFLCKKYIANYDQKQKQQNKLVFDLMELQFAAYNRNTYPKQRGIKNGMKLNKRCFDCECNK